MTATLPSAHLFAIRRRRRGDKVVLTPNLQVIFHVIWRVLGKIISFEGFENLIQTLFTMELTLMKL